VVYTNQFRFSNMRNLYWKLFDCSTIIGPYTYHLVYGQCAYIILLCYLLKDANERLKPLPSVPGDRETLLRLLNRRQQEIDHLTGEVYGCQQNQEHDVFIIHSWQNCNEEMAFCNFFNG